MSNVIIHADELQAATNCFSSSNSPLLSDSNDSNSMTETLNNFIENSVSSLTGEAWNSVRNKLGEYNALLVQRMNLANTLGEAIQQALKLLTDYMEGYESLDTSKLEEIEQAKTECENNILKLNEMLNATVDIMEDGEKKTVSLYDHSAIYSRLGEIRSTLNELNKLIDKIKGLELVYKQAEQILSEAFENVKSFGNSVSNIVPTEESHFIPTEDTIGFGTPIYPMRDF